MGALWALATPLGAAPDEPTQIVKAAAVVRGQLTGESTTRGPTADVLVTVPESFAADGDLATCYLGRATVPAGCAPHLSGASAPVKVVTYVGRNPPLYYLLVGAPTLIWHTDVAVYAMRLLSILWSALLLGLALTTAAVLSRSRLLVAAVAIATTPLVVFLASVVNPSGLQISAAVATWTTGLVLVVEHRHRPPPLLVAGCAVSASLLALSGGICALWLALIALTLAALAPGAIADLWRTRQVRLATTGVTACGVAAVAFALHADSLAVLPVGKAVAAHISTIGIVVDALGRTGPILRQAVGTFGWLDTPSPLGVLLGWWFAVGLLVTLGLVTAWRRQAVVLAGLLTVAVALPTAIMASQARHDGLIWQARDGMPLYVGIPLVAAIALHQRATSSTRRETWLHDRIVRWLLGLLAGGIALGQLADFAWALRRYTVGLGSTLNPLDKVPGGWAPPVPTLLLLAAAAVGCATYGWWIHQLVAIAPKPPARPRPRHSASSSAVPRPLNGTPALGADQAPSRSGNEGRPPGAPRSSSRG